MCEIGREELKKFHKECDEKFAHLVLLKQIWAAVFKEYLASYKNLGKTPVDKIKKVNLILIENHVEELFERIKEAPRTDVKDEGAKRFVKETWAHINEIMIRCTQYSGKYEASDVFNIYRLLLEAEGRCSKLIRRVDEIIMERL